MSGYAPRQGTRVSATVEGSLVRQATLWLIKLRASLPGDHPDLSGQDEILLTDHDQPIEFGGKTYSPMDGATASAAEANTGLSSRNVDVIGILSDSRVRHEDLRAGRYEGAIVYASLVDWQYPWLGRTRQDRYRIHDVSIRDDEWTATVVGIAAQLEREEGRLLSRTCRFVLGSSGCGFPLDDFKVLGQVSSASAVLSGFTTQSANVLVDSGVDDSWFVGGVVEWTSGDNSGIKSEVIAYETAGSPVSSGTFTLLEDVPNPIKNGDQFQVARGCMKRLQDCQSDKFNHADNDGGPGNSINFGGHPFMPTNDRFLDAPEGRSQQ